MMKRLANLYPWATPVILLVGSLFNGQQVLTDQPVGITAWLLGAVPALLLGLVLLPWAAARAELWRHAWWALGAFLLLLGWGGLRSIGGPRCLVTFDMEPVGWCFPDWVAWVPLVQAGVTAGLAWVLLAHVAVELRRSWLTVAAAAVVVGTLIALIRSPFDPRGFTRLFSGLGGAAVLAVALTIVAAVLLSWCLTQRRWRIPAGVAAGIAVGCVILTFSRAGLAVLVLTAVVLAWRFGGGNRRLAWAVAGAGLAAGVVAALVFPDQMWRLLTLGDPDRAQNAVVALNHWATTPVLGAGTARVWPWFGVDAAVIWAPETGLYGPAGVDGEVLVNPHSTFLAVLVELGVVGLIPLLVLMIAVGWQAMKTTDSTPESWGLLAAVCCVPAFLLDTYLLRNPGVSFVWWLAVFTGLVAAARPGVTQSDTALQLFDDSSG